MDALWVRVHPVTFNDFPTGKSLLLHLCTSQPREIEKE